MSRPDIFVALARVVEALEELEIRYSVVGSVASSSLGVPRSTIDADLVADLPGSKVDALVANLVVDCYVDRDAAIDAVRRRSMFNVIHLATMLKVDIYVVTSRPFDIQSFDRGRVAELHPDDRRYVVATAEDVVLHKLEWYRLGGEVSERQWADVVGVLRVQTDAVDVAYMRRWAATLGIEDLLSRALGEAGGASRT
jgi:hypothetical protein